MAHACGLACRLCGCAEHALGALLARSVLLALPALLGWLHWPKLCSGCGCAVFRSVFCRIGHSGRNERQYGAEKNHTGISTHGTLLSPPAPFYQCWQGRSMKKHTGRGVKSRLRFDRSCGM